MGHPIGASGEFGHFAPRHGGPDALGLTTLCIGGGQGYAVVVERL